MHGTNTTSNYTVAMYITHEGEYDHGRKEGPPKVEIGSSRGQPATKGEAGSVAGWGEVEVGGK